MGEKKIVKLVRSSGLSIREITLKEKEIGEACCFDSCKENATVFMESFFLCDEHAQKLLDNIVSNKESSKLKLRKDSKIQFDS